MADHTHTHTHTHTQAHAHTSHLTPHTSPAFPRPTLAGAAIKDNLLFQDLPAAALEVIIDSMHPAEVPPGTDIIRQVGQHAASICMHCCYVWHGAPACPPACPTLICPCPSWVMAATCPSLVTAATCLTLLPLLSFLPVRHHILPA